MHLNSSFPLFTYMLLSSIFHCYHFLKIHYSYISHYCYLIIFLLPEAYILGIPFFVVVCFCFCLQHMEVFGPGIKPAPHQLPCSDNLNLLSHKGTPRYCFFMKIFLLYLSNDVFFYSFLKCQLL